MTPMALNRTRATHCSVNATREASSSGPERSAPEGLLTMPQTLLIALHQQQVARDSGSELPLPEPNHGQRLSVLLWLLLACALMALLVADALISPVSERSW